ncbi:MAG TPA: AraC family transcriptional regulator [Luteimonas sp.]|nr:AraC family transcriptional regulator [Luteimonas sp.]
MTGWIARMERALALLATRLDDPPSLDELAAAANVSPFHFHRTWRAMTGETLGQSVARLRVAQAQARLADGDVSITEVAMDGGFATPQSFARAFRRVTGMSPSGFLSGGAQRTAVDPKPDATVRIELRAAGQLVALRKEGGAYRALNALFQQLWDWADAAGRLGGLQGIYGLPLDDPESVPESRLRYLACLALDDASRPPAPFEMLALEAGEYATLRHTGDYAGLEDANQRLLVQVLASGREPADFPLFHHFLDDPEEVAPELLRTDVLVRLGAGGGRLDEPT